MKKILVLEPNATGGRKIVETARKLGYLVFGVTQKDVFDRLYEEHFKEKFDGMFFTDFSNEECIDEITRYALKEKIDAVVSGFEFMSNITVKVASRVNLPTHDYNLADALRNKALMYECFVKNNVPTAKTTVINSLDQLISCQQDITFPLIIKPAENAGSCGVFKASNLEELFNYYNVILEDTIEFPHGFQLSRQVLLQEVLDGDEYSVEVVIAQGQASLICITDKITTSDNYFAELGHTLPTSQTDDNKELITKIAFESIKALGLQNGVAHVELKFTEDGPKIIEVGARLPGDYIPELIEAALGIDQAEIYLKTTLGELVDVTPISNKYAAIRFITVSQEGVFQKLNFSINQEDDNTFITQYIKQGEWVSPSTNNISRLGHVMCIDSTSEEVNSRCSRIMYSINAEILEGVKE
ncbi:ATP-grasp domain-containing protein [Priestia megaterium]|uniref:ATP-grasp domain-containing protein n=1 Tax=Priestia megaterium TaxID=1404 RepID=UPI000BF8BC33|nr:ATP-grasp domain-containing protein [Priestia megaterium]MED4051017.1 ATP-grasp domain-containing protein [Priestia megaterium]PEZ06098.1 hypothetical protein CN330_27565 [Priestia megaterium]